MHTSNILEATAAVLTVLGGLTAYIYSLGRTNGKLTSTLSNNTSAIEKLTDLYERHVGKFDDLDTRVTIVETTLHIKK